MKEQRFIDEGTDIKEREKNVKNKWRWDWLDHPKPISNKPEDRILEKDKWRVWLRKLDCPGKVFCTVCSETINYGSNGKKALNNHASSETHKKNSRVVQSNETMPGASKTAGTGDSMSDRTAKLKV